LNLDLILPDVNILVYAHREDAPDHLKYRAWLEDLVNADAAYGVCGLVLSGFLRVVTHPKVFSTPSTIRQALAFADQIRGQPNAVPVEPGARHWAIFRRLCGDHDVKGNLVPDAYLAALAIESGCEWLSTDRDFRRFKGLRWRHPFD
jgi:toxin-antitoxin system PIN domain toxin